MRKGLRVAGALAMSLVAPHFAAAQSSIPIPPPGTPVRPIDVPAHVVSAPLERTEKPTNRRIINTPSAQIEYRVDTIGPSGIGRVDIYITPDRGATWTKLSEDADKQSPANINLPGEGLFGVRIAITNGNGFGGRVPKAGDRPQMYVEVDAASPVVQLNPVEMVPSIGAIDIRWAAMDPNLAPEPISVFYRSNSEGWRPIAQNIKNDGVYRWTLPRDVAAAIYLKIEAVDLAGNATKVESPTPILLDQTEPEATIIDASPVQRGSSPSVVTFPAPTPAPVPVTPASLPAPLPAPAASPIAPPPLMPANMPASLPTLPPAPQLSN